ncbi:MAG: RDD family protein [Nocardioides sp.]
MAPDGHPPDSESGEPPWSPYPDDWDTFTSQPQPAQHFGPPPQAGAPPGRAAPPQPYAEAPTAPAFAFGGFASWLSRVGASVIDSILGAIAGLPVWVGEVMLFSGATTTTDADGVDHLHLHQTTGSLILIVIGCLTSLAFFVWNVCLRQGRTGATIGKSVLGLRLVDKDLHPIGGGRAFLRNLLHVVDALPCCFGYLWPIWDSQRQTFADKIMGTVVINASTVQPRAF